MDLDKDLAQYNLTPNYILIDGVEMGGFDSYIMREPHENPDYDKYYISIISHRPIEELEYIKNPTTWFKEVHEIIVSDYSICENILVEHRWLPDRYKFQPIVPDNDGWVNNVFTQKDIIAVKVCDEVGRIPYLSEINHRFKLVHNGTESESNAETGIAILNRQSVWSATNLPGSYDVEFAYS